MTIGERNQNIIRMRESGLTTKVTAEVLGTTETTAEKVISRYNKDGEKMFESTRQWIPNEKPDNLIGVHTEFFPSDFNRQMEILRRTIRVGDSVKIGGGKTMIVEEVHKNLVYGHTINNPCWTCKDKVGCKNKCDRHASYIYHRMPITKTYVDLIEAGNGRR